MWIKMSHSCKLSSAMRRIKTLLASYLCWKAAAWMRRSRAFKSHFQRFISSFRIEVSTSPAPEEQSAGADGACAVYTSTRLSQHHNETLKCVSVKN